MAKALIFVVAYAAAAHIEALLDKVAVALPALKAFDPHILIIDDASPDNTAALAEKYKARGTLPMTVLRNPVNQGYGGNQKIGYQYALRFGFDSIVLLHGDGQYPPEQIGAMLEAMQTQNADVVLGSRMLERKNALKGGMPFYKFIGNIILTRLQNAILDMRLSEFHTGFRAYRTSFLTRIPFAYNSNDFDFDTDILIQARLSSATIAEIPIPTHYGEEICHVNGMKYAGQIIRNSVLAKCQGYQIFYHPKFDFTPESEYAAKIGCDSNHDFALNHVDAYDTVVNIGSYSGDVTTLLRRQKGCYVYGIDSAKNPVNAEQYDTFTQLDLDRENITAAFPHDRAVQKVLLLDVLEKLNSPEKFLAALRVETAASESKIIVTNANVGFILTRLSMLIGNFNYSKRGILDFNHKRLFTFGSLQQMLRNYGYIIDEVQGIPIPFNLMVKHRAVAKLLTSLNRLLMRINRRLFSYQIAIIARPAPTLDLLLTRAEESPIGSPAQT